MRVDITWVHKDGMLIRTLEDLKFSIRGPKLAADYTIEKGYVSDGGTIPKIFWFILSPFEDYFTCCLLHDYLCDLATFNKDIYFYRKHADELFNEAMKQASIKKSTRLTLYAGVSLYRILRYNKLAIKWLGRPMVQDYNKKFFIGMPDRSY